MTTTSTLSGRDRAILRAVAAGGAQLQLGAEPDLFFDGRCCCDQTAAHHLVRAGLIDRRHAGPGRPARRRRPHPGRTPGPGRLRPRRLTARLLRLPGSSMIATAVGCGAGVAGSVTRCPATAIRPAAR